MKHKNKRPDQAYIIHNIITHFSKYIKPTSTETHNKEQFITTTYIYKIYIHLLNYNTYNI